MPLPNPTRLSFLLCLTLPLAAQSMQTPAAQAPWTQPAPSSPNRASITYANDQLTVQADNSSLNQILHEISRIAGVTITGGVAEERVFGKYGPGSLSEVLGQLLDGTSTNMLFIASSGDKTPQLILTPRNGRPSPPNPNAARFDNNPEAASIPAPSEPPAQAPPQNPPPPPSESNNSPAPAETGSPSQSSSSGVKTPQQIYDELMRLRQQQQNNNK
ncbi:hypothetical protein [Edaphobacter albus]|uniref:hypothetical protein n=1 Tax=Edaphobacter sp. 4G125 TaxID=2763071 RepID=UPI0016440445|nr:hypothetical protein [Edaphobacter sp. 4G125]QNI37954.1 hypothetical protein H7846_06725 [Edaphobacter sp. 4G125]